MKHCKDCEYFIGSEYCDVIDVDDDEYTSNNDSLVGIKYETLDDSGLDIWLRVEKDFGCVKFQPKNPIIRDDHE